MHAALDAAESERAGLSTAVLDLLPARSADLPPLLARFLRSWLKGRIYSLICVVRDAQSKERLQSSHSWLFNPRSRRPSKIKPVIA